LKRFVAAMALCLGAAPAGAEAPAVNYLLQCQGCHRPDGGATPGTVPALDGQVARFLSLPGGREYLVRVPGSAQAPLDDAELAELLNWLVRRFGPAADAERAAPFSAEEVGPLRVRPLTDVAATRRGLVELMNGESGVTP
jgi:mono/diheme cytochrome c family protein